MRFRFLFEARPLALAVVFSLLPAIAFSTPPPQPQTAQELAAAADPNDPIVAQIAAERLQQWNFSQQPFDEQISTKFFDLFLDRLDHFHMFFIQPDIHEFEQYRTNLNVLTLRRQDITPCWVIFSRFMERVHQRFAFDSNLLETAHFEFTNHDRFILDRHSLPYPKDLDQAKELWRQELRSVYLGQLLTSADVQFAGPASADTNGQTVVKLTCDKTHPCSLDYLPATFLAQDGHPIGWVEVAPGRSNATVRLAMPIPENLKKTTNHLYSPKGGEIGDITFRREKTETNDAASARATAHPEDNPSTNTQSANLLSRTNQPEAQAAPGAPSTNLLAIIHLDQKDLEKIHKTLTNDYSQHLDNFNALAKDGGGRAFEAYVNSLARAFDPHSDYMAHNTAENFGIQMKLSLFGIGAMLQADHDYCKIIELRAGPAKKSGKIHVNDRIVAVCQSNAMPVDVEGMSLDKIVDMIRGPKGTEVILTLVPSDAPDISVRHDVTLVRDEIKLEDQEAKARLYEEPGVSGPASRLGVINIPSFYANNEASNPGSTGSLKSMTEDVKRLIARLQQEKVGGIILDLRANGGGFLEEAENLTGLFVPAGPVVQTKDSNGEIVTEPCRDKSVFYNGPLIVLISRFSASASEILAGALQDYNRALIVGDHSTFGKGTVQTMQSLKPSLANYLRRSQLPAESNYDPGDVKITIKKFYRPGGVSTQLTGVLSDIELPSKLNVAKDDVGESALPNALPCDSVTTANPPNLNRVKPCLAELQERSLQRVNSSRDFDYIKEDIAEFLKQQADKSISLNLAERQAEQKAHVARADAVKKEIMSRKKSGEKVFEVTLENLDQAQLQPLVKTNLVATTIDASIDDELDPGMDAMPEGSEDPALEESKHILADYITLMNKEPAISSATSSATAR